MKNLLGIIRWKFVLPVGLAIAAILVFFIVFFDPIAERAVENVGSKINGAKVEVDGLKTKFLKGRIEIVRLQVANKSNPMTNTWEAGPLVFQMDLSELFSKRVVVHEAGLKGVQFSTSRKTSGALPPKIRKKQKKDEAPGAASKLVEKYKDRFKISLEGLQSDAKAKIEFDPKDLRLVRQAEDLKETATDLPVQWEKTVEELNAGARLKKIEEELKSIKEVPTKGAEAITAIPAGLKKLKAVKEDLENLKKEVSETKESASRQLKDLKNGISSLPAAKKKDVEDLLSRFNLDFADPDRLVEGIVGPAVLSRFQTAIHYIELARKHMPSQKVKESLPPRPRASGMDISFPTPAAPPRFWLKKAFLDGSYHGLTVEGMMTHLTSNPTRVGKPFVMEASGKSGHQKYAAQIKADHVGEKNNDSLAVQMSGFDVSQMIGSGPELGLLADGQGSADLALSLLGEGNMGGQLVISLARVKINEERLLNQVGIKPGASLSKEEELKANFLKNVGHAIEKMPEVKITAQLYGTWREPGMKISSNLGSVLSKVIKESVGNLVQDQKRQLEAKLESILKEKTKEVEAKAVDLQGKLSGQIGTLETRIQEKANEAVGINLAPEGGSSSLPGIKIPSLDKLFKK